MDIQLSQQHFFEDAVLFPLDKILVKKNTLLCFSFTLNTVLIEYFISDVFVEISPTPQPSNSEILQITAGWVSYRFNSILILYTWRKHQISQVKCSFPQDCPLLPEFRCQSQDQGVTYASGQLAITWRFPPTSFYVQLICWS